MIGRPFQRLWADRRGGVLVEFAAVVPGIIMVIVGLLQTSSLLYANAAMRTALGDGARTATLYRTPASATAWAGPTATEICDSVENSISSLGNAQITALTLTRTTNGTANALALAINYRVNLNFVLFTKAATLSSSRRVYVGSQPNFGATAFNCLA